MLIVETDFTATENQTAGKNPGSGGGRGSPLALRRRRAPALRRRGSPALRRRGPPALWRRRPRKDSLAAVAFIPLACDFPEYKYQNVCKPMETQY